MGWHGVVIVAKTQPEVQPLSFGWLRLGLALVLAGAVLGAWLLDSGNSPAWLLQGVVMLGLYGAPLFALTDGGINLHGLRTGTHRSTLSARLSLDLALLVLWALLIAFKY